MTIKSHLEQPWYDSSCVTIRYELSCDMQSVLNGIAALPSILTNYIWIQSNQ